MTIYLKSSGHTNSYWIIAVQPQEGNTIYQTGWTSLLSLWSLGWMHILLVAVTMTVLPTDHTHRTRVLDSLTIFTFTRVSQNILIMENKSSPSCNKETANYLSCWHTWGDCNTYQVSLLTRDKTDDPECWNEFDDTAIKSLWLDVRKWSVAIIEFCFSDDSKCGNEEIKFTSSEIIVNF